MEFEGQNNDFGGTKRYNNIPLVPPNSFGPPPMGAVGPDFKDRAQGILLSVTIQQLYFYPGSHILVGFFILTCSFLQGAVVGANSSGRLHLFV